MGRNSGGQAVLEYLFILALMVMISVTMAKGLSTAMGKGVEKLGYVLTQQLSVGSCDTNCYFGRYKNTPTP